MQRTKYKKHLSVYCNQLQLTWSTGNVVTPIHFVLIHYHHHHVVQQQRSCVLLFTTCPLLSDWTFFSFSYFPPSPVLTVVNGEHLVLPVLPPISWTSAPLLPSSCPCSRDGSSHTEQFPISFVHAGSPKPPVQLLLTVLPAAPLNFTSAVVSYRQYSVRLHFKVCHFVSPFLPLSCVVPLFIPSPLSVLLFYCFFFTSFDFWCGHTKIVFGIIQQ